jgi:RNA polymerase sigma-70 factor (TIGR02943 family)
MDSALQPSKWLASYGNYLYSLAFFKSGNKEVAEDLVQETFLAAVKAKDSFKGESSEKTWLTAILNNKIIDFYRKKDVLKDSAEYVSETESSFQQNFFESEGGHWKADTAPRSWEESADEALNRGDFNRVLEYCIGKMPSKLVPVFIAKYIDDRDSDEICKELNISPSNYWVILHRAKVLMRSCLERNWMLK